MKTLLLLRHAKSSRKHLGVTDHDRLLNARGERDALRVGRVIEAEAVRPDIILSSTARRAWFTAKVISDALSLPGKDMVLDNRLYLAEPAEIVDVVREVGNDARCVLVVGHNPGLEVLVMQLTGHEESLPTAALAVVRLSMDSWRSLELRVMGQLERVCCPRERSL